MPAFEGEEVIMRKPMTSRGEASSSPAIPICPMIWRERAAERMQEGIPVSPGPAEPAAADRSGLRRTLAAG